jgi:hypothetical protein
MESVTKPARRRRELPPTERWPPKDGQPTPRHRTERFSMSFDRAPLASGRAAHADDGVWGKLTMTSDRLMKAQTARLST